MTSQIILAGLHLECVPAEAVRQLNPIDPCQTAIASPMRKLLALFALEALRDVRNFAIDFDRSTCLALTVLFTDKTIVAPSRKPLVTEVLPFPDNARLIACARPSCQLSPAKASFGRTQPKDALGYWLIFRHATHFKDTVEAGKIVPWIRVADAHDERRACKWLFARSSGSVNVHDTIAPGTNGQ